jgi:hypothetical protein
MNHPHPGPARTRIARVKLELLKSVSGLKDDQKLFIIFFNDKTYPMPARQLVAATDSTRRKYLEWMARARADGETDPYRALMLAIELRPDIIYFLTDGEFRGGIVKDVAAANRGRVRIHTIGFGDDMGEDLLKAIASQNGGNYQFISADEEDEDLATQADSPAR